MQSTPTVSVDLSGLDRQSYDELQASGVYKSLLVRLVSDRLAVVDVDEGAALRLAFTRTNAATLRITATTSTSVDQRDVVLANLRDEDAQLQVIHAALQLARDARGKLAVTPTLSLGTTPTSDDEPHRYGVRGGTLALLSGGELGLMLDAQGSMRFDVVSVDLGALVHRPLGLPRTLAVTEWGAYVGTHLHADVAPAVSIRAGFDLGLWQHHFDYGPTDSVVTSSDAGLRRTPLAMMRAAAAWALDPAWSLALEVGALTTLHEWRHRDARAVLWRAPHVRAFLGLFLELVI